MVRYRRNFVAGGTYFFTVTLAGRTSSALMHHVDALRMAFRIARQERPFTIEGIVILPEHLHAVWTLPSGDLRFLRPLEANHAETQIAASSCPALCRASTS